MNYKAKINNLIEELNEDLKKAGVNDVIYIDGEHFVSRNMASQGGGMFGTIAELVRSTDYAIRITKR